MKKSAFMEGVIGLLRILFFAFITTLAHISWETGHIFYCMFALGFAIEIARDIVKKN